MEAVERQERQAPISSQCFGEVLHDQPENESDADKNTGYAGPRLLPSADGVPCITGPLFRAGDEGQADFAFEFAAKERKKAQSQSVN
jgi:hypothetical protein